LFRIFLLLQDGFYVDPNLLADTVNPGQKLFRLPISDKLVAERQMILICCVAERLVSPVMEGNPLVIDKYMYLITRVNGFDLFANKAIWDTVIMLFQLYMAILHDFYCLIFPKLVRCCR